MKLIVLGVLLVVLALLFTGCVDKTADVENSNESMRTNYGGSGRYENVLALNTGLTADNTAETNELLREILKDCDLK